MKIYLSHPTKSREVIESWQKYFEKETGFELINPFAGEGLKNEKEIEVLESEIKNVKKLVMGDLRSMLNCDCVVAVFDNNYSVGVPIEIAYAKTNGLKVYSIVVNGRENNPFIRYFSDLVFLDFNELIGFFKAQEVKQ